MNPQPGDVGTYHGDTAASDLAAFVAQVNEDGTLEISVLRPGFETLAPVSAVAVGTGSGQWSPRA